jgi:uncharacterized protein
MQARSWIALAVLALITALVARDSAGWRPDNRIAGWVQRGAARERQQLLTEEFGGDEFVLLRVEGIDLAGDDLAWLEQSTKSLNELAALSQVLEPLSLPGSASGSPRERLERAAKRPLAVALDLVDLSDWSAVRYDMLLAVEPEARPAARDRVALAVHELQGAARERGLRLRAAGHPLLASALDVESLRVDELFAPLLVLLSLLVLTSLFRSLPVALAAVLPAAIASAGARAALKHLEIPSNLILVALGPVLFVIVLASTLHLISAFRRLRVLDIPPRRAAALAWSQLHRATLLAAGTSALGFGVFATSSVDAVATLGVSLALGIAIATPLALIACRFVLSGLAHTPTPLRGRASGALFRRLALTAWRRRAIVACGAALIFSFGVQRSFELDFASDALDYFPSGHPVREQFQSLDADGAALSTIELVIAEPPQDRGDSLTSKLLEVEGVRRVLGPEVIERDLRATLGGVGAKLALGPALVESGRVSRGGGYTRWSLFTTTGGAEEMNAIAAHIEATCDDWLGADERERFTCGSLLGTLEMQIQLTSTLVTSLGLTLIVTTLLFLLVVTSLTELLAAMAVNLFPVATVMLVNASSFSQIDPATVMVTAVVLGLAVDNTLHLLHYAGAHGRERTRRDRVRAFQAVGEPALASSCALALGFGALALSTFAPTARFGTLVATGVLAAALSDFVLLPALWLSKGRAKRVN